MDRSQERLREDDKYDDDDDDDDNDNDDTFHVSDLMHHKIRSSSPAPLSRSRELYILSEASMKAGLIRYYQLQL